MTALLVYGLSALWSIGCIGGIILLIWYMINQTEYGIAFALFFLGLPFAVLLAILPWAAIADFKSEDLAVLKKNAWACTATRTETTMMPVTTGKTTVMVPTTTTVCIQYSRTH